MITEISVILKNTPGTLSKVLELLNEHSVNVLAFSIDPEIDKDSTIRLICCSSDLAKQVLKSKGYTCYKKQVVAVKISHQPGALLLIANVLFRNDLNINYAYLTLVPNTNDAIVIFDLDRELTNEQCYSYFKKYGEAVMNVAEFLKKGDGNTKKFMTFIMKLINWFINRPNK